MESPVLQLVLPWPPSVNGYWRTFRGRQIISKRGREYRERVREIVASQLPNWQAIDYRTQVLIDLFPPTLREYDVDNFRKAMYDALTHAGVLSDDSLIHLDAAAKQEKRPPGLVAVEIYKLPSTTTPRRLTTIKL